MTMHIWYWSTHYNGMREPRQQHHSLSVLHINIAVSTHKISTEEIFYYARLGQHKDRVVLHSSWYSNLLVCMNIYAYVCTYLHRNLGMCICAPAVTRADRSLTSTSPAMLVFFSTSVALHAAPRICGYACKGTYQDCKRPQLTPYFAHTKFGESMMCLALLCWHPLSYFLMILFPISYKSYAS